MEWDFVIVGSGFGGSVSALRLVEKGYGCWCSSGAGDSAPRISRAPTGICQVAVDAAGRVPRPLQDDLLAPRHRALRRRRGRRLAGLREHAAGAEGRFFAAPSWAALADWKRELDAALRTARACSGAVQNPDGTMADDICARSRGPRLADKFEPARVAVYFGEPEKTVPDPYFGGEGPDRTGCTQCGACMIGCRHNAKNTLDKNYLWLAEKRGLRIEADTEVTLVRSPPEAAIELEVVTPRGLVRQAPKRSPPAT